jgi:Berberine and berberine like
LTTRSQATFSLPRLRAALDGDVIGPHDAGYDVARAVRCRTLDRRPAAIELEAPPLAASRTMFLDAVDEDVAESILAHLRASTAQTAALQIRVLGGAVARVSSEATAYAHRSRPIMASVGALDGGPGGHEEWVREVASALRQGEPGAYVNFLGDEGAERVRDAYPGQTWERLAAIKREYDPENLFRLNQNVPPARE